MLKREPSPFSGRYMIGTAKRLTVDIFKYKGDLYGSFQSTSTPAKLMLLGPARYSLDALRLKLTFHRNSSARVTGLTLVQGAKTLQAKKIQ
jgi:hypothetical protein